MTTCKKCKTGLMMEDLEESTSEGIKKIYECDECGNKAEAFFCDLDIENANHVAWEHEGY
jgi:RNase P subunit RPR2